MIEYVSNTSILGRMFSKKVKRINEIVDSFLALSETEGSFGNARVVEKEYRGTVYKSYELDVTMLIMVVSKVSTPTSRMIMLKYLTNWWRDELIELVGNGEYK